MSEDIKVEVQAELTGLGPEPSVEQLKKTVIYMVNVFERQYATTESERQVFIRALKDAQKYNDKLEHALHKTLRARFIMFIKKILVARDWYECSSEELQLIHDENFGAHP